MNTVAISPELVARVVDSTKRLQAILDHIAVTSHILPRSVYTAIDRSVADLAELRSAAEQRPGAAAAAAGFAAGCLAGLFLKR